MTGLLILGAGGLGRETAQAALAAGTAAGALGFLDDTVPAGTRVAGIPVLGPLTAVAQYPNARVVIAVGAPDGDPARQRIAARLGLPGHRFAQVIHPGALLAGDTDVGPGAIVLAGVVATAGVRIGAHVALMPAVVATHDCVIGDFATLATGVHLAGRVRVGAGAYLGAGTSVRQDVVVGAAAMTGMGSLVLDDVAAGRLVFGQPARDRGPAPALRAANRAAGAP